MSVRKRKGVMSLMEEGNLKRVCTEWNEEAYELRQKLLDKDDEIKELKKTHNRTIEQLIEKNLGKRG